MIDPKNNNNNDIKDALLDDEMQYNEEVRLIIIVQIIMEVI